MPSVLRTLDGGRLTRLGGGGLKLLVQPAVATFPVAKLWRGTEQLDAWLEWYGFDADGAPQTFPWAERFLTDRSKYFNGRKDARILDWGRYELALSDRTGQLQGTTLSYTIRNDDQLIGRWQDNPNQSTFPTVQNVIRLIFESDRLQELDPIVAFRGLVKGTGGRAGFKVAVSGQDWLSMRIAGAVPLWDVFTDFGGADQFPIANKGLKGALVYGRHSDEGSTTGAPTIVPDDAAHLSMDGVTGIGDLPTAPSGVAVSESVGAGSINLGDVPSDEWFVAWTRVVAGVESQMNGRRGDEHSVVIANNSAAIASSITPDGADTYRAYLGFQQFGRIIYTQMKEEPSGAVLFTDSADASEVAGSTPASWPITPGAVLTNVLQRWMAISAEMPDGETVLCARQQYTGFPFARPARIAISPVASALRYHAYSADSPTTGPFLRHKTFETTDVNADSNPFVEDAWTTAEWEVITTQKTPQGVVPGVCVGMLPDASGFKRVAIAFAASPLKSYISLYTITAGVVTKVDPAMFGLTWFVPGQSGYSARYTNPWFTTTSGHTWSVVFLDGPPADTILTGETQVFANVEGIEDVGDTTGTLIDSLIDQTVHFARNFWLTDTPYAGGPWATEDPAWLDGTSRIDTAAIAALKAVYSTSITAGDAGAWILNTASRTVDVLALLMISLDCFYCFTKGGQFRLVLMPPDLSNPAPLVDLTEISHLEEDSFTWDDQTDPSWYWNQASFSALPTFTPTGVGTWGATDTVNDTAAQAKVGIIPDQFAAQFVARSAIAPVDEIMARRLARSSTAPRTATFTTSLNGLTLEPGDVVTLTHREAPSTAGWVQHGGLITSLAIDPQQQKVGVTVLDLGLVTTTLTVADRTVDYSASDQIVSLGATVTAPGFTIDVGTVHFTVYDVDDVTPLGTAVDGAVAANDATADYTLPGGTGA